MNPSTRPTTHDVTRALFDTLSNWAGVHANVVLDLPAPLGVTEGLLEALPDDEAIVLAPRDEPVVVGLGAALELTARGPERLTQIARRASSATFDRVTLPGGTPEPVRFLGGFAFESESAPDWGRFGAARFVVPRWTYRRDGEVASLQAVVDAETAPRMAGRIVAEYASILAALRRGVLTRAPSAVRVRRDDEAEYAAAVASAVEAIRAREANKIVLARESIVEADTPFSAAHVFRALLGPGPALAFALRCGGQTFVGASPERLVRVSGRQATTEALAGTAEASEALETLKNLEEHRLVVRWIRDRLEPVSEAVVAPDRPVVRRLPHVAHLATPIESRLLAPMHVLAVADALYPTPAIAGTPLGVALRTIGSLEGRPRGWYSGAVGSFDTHGEGELHVALRSALIEGGRARVFVGAGIVADSEPDAELRETIAKERTMLDALAPQATGAERAAP